MKKLPITFALFGLLALSACQHGHYASSGAARAVNKDLKTVSMMGIPMVSFGDADSMVMINDYPPTLKTNGTKLVYTDHTLAAHGFAKGDAQGGVARIFIEKTGRAYPMPSGDAGLQFIDVPSASRLMVQDPSAATAFLNRFCQGEPTVRDEEHCNASDWASEGSTANRLQSFGRFIDATRYALNATKVSLIGAENGGTIAMLLAAKQPDLVAEVRTLDADLSAVKTLPETEQSALAAIPQLHVLRTSPDMTTEQQQHAATNIEESFGPCTATRFAGTTRDLIADWGEYATIALPCTSHPIARQATPLDPSRVAYIKQASSWVVSQGEPLTDEKLALTTEIAEATLTSSETEEMGELFATILVAAQMKKSFAHLDEETYSQVADKLTERLMILHKDMINQRNKTFAERLAREFDMPTLAKISEAVQSERKLAAFLFSTPEGHRLVKLKRDAKEETRAALSKQKDGNVFLHHPEITSILKENGY